MFGLQKKKKAFKWDVSELDKIGIWALEGDNLDRQQMRLTFKYWDSYAANI